MNNNATEPAIALGLHTCAGELRRAKLRRSAGRIEVLSLDRQPMELSSGPQATGGSADNSSLSGSPVATAAVMTNGAVCVATMPSADVMTRLWSMPAADGSRLRQMVAHRLEADLPIPLEQLAWGCRAGKLPESGPPGLTVMAQAARNERVSRQMARLVELGMAVDVLTTEAEAIENLLRLGMREQTPPSGDADPEAVILATPDDWLVAVRSGGFVQSVRHVSADSGRPEVTLQNCRQMIEAVHPLRDLRRVRWAATPDVVVAELLAEHWSMPIEPLEPAETLVGPNGGRLIAADLAEFGPAIGLGLAALDEPDVLIRLAGRERETLSPRRQQIERLLATPGRWVAAAGILFVLMVGTHIGALTWERAQMKRLITEYDPATSPMVALEPKIRAMERINTYRINVEDVVARICAQMPNSVLVSSIQLTREQGLVIKGTCGDSKALFKWVDALRQDPRLDQIQPGRTEPGKGGGFTLTAQVVGTQRLAGGRQRGAR